MDKTAFLLAALLATGANAAITNTLETVTSNGMTWARHGSIDQRRQMVLVDVDRPTFGDGRWALRQGLYDLYVSPDGDDANDGRSAGTAKRTIDAALAEMTLDGTRIHLAEGEYGYPKKLRIPESQTGGWESYMPSNWFEVVGAGAGRTIIRPEDGDEGPHVWHARHDLRSSVVSGVSFVGLSSANMSAWDGSALIWYGSLAGCTFRDCMIGGCPDMYVNSTHISFIRDTFEHCLFTGIVTRVAGGKTSGSHEYRGMIFGQCELTGCVWKDNTVSQPPANGMLMRYCELTDTIVHETNYWPRIIEGDMVVRRSTLLFAEEPGDGYTHPSQEYEIRMDDSFIAVGANTDGFVTNTANCLFMPYAELLARLGADFRTDAYDLWAYGIGAGAATNAGPAKAWTRALAAQVAQAATNYTDAALGGGWLRPGDWVVNATVVPQPTTVENISFKTNMATATIASNSTVILMHSLTADLSVEPLDDSIPESAFGSPVYSALDGGSVTNDRFYATEPGLYRVGATTSLGVRYTDVPLTSYRSVESNATVYVADADIEDIWRKDVNDLFLSNLVASTHAATGTVDGVGYDVWWTVRCPCRPISGHTVQGYRSRNALSPHLLIAVRHYGVDGNYSYLTFRDPVGNTNVTANSKGRMTGPTAYDFVDIPAGYGFPLCMWALTNGFTRAELADMHIEDVTVFPISDGGTLPDACCPYFMTLNAWRKHFGGKGNVGAWATSQTYANRTGPDGILAGNYMTPCILNIGNLETQTYGASSWTCACYSWTSAVRADVLAQWREMKAVEGGAGAFPPIYAGDSSGGVYIRDGQGRWIMASMYTTVGSGASLSAAVPVLRKLCAQYGDTLKEIDE